MIDWNHNADAHFSRDPLDGTLIMNKHMNVQLLCIWLIKFQHKRGSNTFALLVYAAAIISVVSMTTCMCCWLDNNQ